MLIKEKGGNHIGSVNAAIIVLPNKLNHLMQNPSQTLKYSIKQRLQKLPGTFRDNKYKLCIKLSITEKTLTKWLDVNFSERFSLPVDALYEIADFFECNPTELINRPND